MKYIFLVVFASLTPLANWMIGNFGTVCVPNGPCLIPVGFGLMSPSGVLIIGVALVMRDFIHEMFGKKVALFAVLLGIGASWLTSNPAIAMASAGAFALAELLDFAVYSRMRARGVGVAVLLSGAAGAFADSAIFVYLAFGSLEFSIGNTLGKLYATVLAAAFLYSYQRGRPA